MKQRGRVLRDTNVGPGLLAVGGKQYTFTLEDMWQSELPPRPGMIVEVSFNAEGLPEEVRAVPETELAQEQSAQFQARTQETIPDWTPEQESSFAAGVRTIFGWLPFAAEALLLIAFFLLPNLFIGNVMGGRGLTGWEAIGFNLATQAITDRGSLSSMALVCLTAPLAAALVKSPWSRWLYTAPLAFTLLASATVALEIRHAGQAASQGVAAVLGEVAASQMTHEVTDMFTIGIGAYLVLLCSAYLASRTLKARS